MRLSISGGGPILDATVAPVGKFALLLAICPDVRLLTCVAVVGACVTDGTVGVVGNALDGVDNDDAGVDAVAVGVATVG